MKRDQRLKALSRTARSTNSWPRLALPHVPSGASSLLNLGLTELNRDPHRKWVVAKRVEANQKVGVEMHTEDDRCVNSSDIKSNRVSLRGPTCLAAVSNL